MTLSYPHRRHQLQSLIHKLGLPEDRVQWDLLDLALTHPTISSSQNYEQLEFVGDAVVRLATSEFLLEKFAELPVGEFAAIRAVLVSDRTLARIAASYNLERYLLLSEHVRRDTLGQESRLAEALEAVMAALYLSTHTLQLVHPWLDAHLSQLIPDIQKDPARQNYKAALQEWSQARYKALPEYRVTEQPDTAGTSHRFRAEVWLQGERLGQGSGRSIKAAEQAAAQIAFLAIYET
jgi:ribonuclease-3